MSSGRPLSRRDEGDQDQEGGSVVEQSGWTQRCSGGKEVGTDLLAGDNQEADITIQLDVFTCFNFIAPVLLYIYLNFLHGDMKM